MTTMYCIGCGATLDGDARFCPYCGTEVEPPTSSTGPRRACRTCGSPVDGDSAFCTACGTPVEAPAPAREELAATITRSSAPQTMALEESPVAGTGVDVREVGASPTATRADDSRPVGLNWLWGFAVGLLPAMVLSAIAWVVVGRVLGLAESDIPEIAAEVPRVRLALLAVGYLIGLPMEMTGSASILGLDIAARAELLAPLNVTRIIAWLPVLGLGLVWGRGTHRRLASDGLFVLAVAAGAVVSVAVVAGVGRLELSGLRIAPVFAPLTQLLPAVTVVAVALLPGIDRRGSEPWRGVIARASTGAIWSTVIVAAAAGLIGMGVLVLNTPDDVLPEVDGVSRLLVQSLVALEATPTLMQLANGGGFEATLQIPDLLLEESVAITAFSVPDPVINGTVRTPWFVQILVLLPLAAGAIGGAIAGRRTMQRWEPLVQGATYCAFAVVLGTGLSNRATGMFEVDFERITGSLEVTAVLAGALFGGLLTTVGAAVAYLGRRIPAVIVGIGVLATVMVVALSIGGWTASWTEVIDYFEQQEVSHAASAL